MFTPFTCQSTVHICHTLGDEWENLGNFGVKMWFRDEPVKQVFPCGFGARNWEWESKTVQKMVRVKEWGGGGVGKKGRKSYRQIPEFWNRPLFMPECAHWHLMLSSAVINWPIKFFVFCGGEMNFWGHLRNQNKVSLYFKSNAWTAEMVKSHWIWTIKAGFKVKFIFLIRLKGRMAWVKFWLKTSRKLDI